MTASTSLVPNDLLLHPSTYDRPEFDATTRRLLGATVDWFEARGKNRLLADYHDKTFTPTSSTSRQRKACSRLS